MRAKPLIWLNGSRGNPHGSPSRLQSRDLQLTRINGVAWTLEYQSDQAAVEDTMRRPATTWSAKTWLFILAVAAMAGTASIQAARADEAQAKNLFKAMSDYLAAQQAISFAYDSNLEVVTDQDQKLGLASSGTLTLNRPDSSMQPAKADSQMSRWSLTGKP